MSYFFVFRESPDIDHLAPVAWKLLDEGHQVSAALSPGHDPQHDHRLDLLSSYPRFRLYGRPRRGLIGAAGAWVGSTLPVALARLRRADAGVMCVEWGYGVPPGLDRLPRAAGLKSALRSLVRSLWRAGRDPQQTRSSYLAAAQILGLRTVALPHGLNTKLDPHQEVRSVVGDGNLAWEDRNRFAAYVLNTEHHRRWHVDRAGGDPAVMQTWGSARWAPEWFEVQRRLAPDFAWPDSRREAVRVVFMLPRWVDDESTVELVRRLHQRDEVSLLLAVHPRSGGGSHPLPAEADLDWSRIHQVAGVNSVSLIKAADVVIDIGSSIGLEVVLQGKVLVNPRYLYELRTLFDDIEGAAVTADGPQDVVDYLVAHAGGARHLLPDAALEELMRRAVYADRSEPFDVLGEYAEKLGALDAEPDAPPSRAPSRVRAA